jgi:hypothetical protein
MKTLLFLVLTFVASSFTFPANDVKLEYTFKVGDQYDYTQSSKQTIKQSIPGMGDITINMDVDGVMLFKVLELTASGARIEAQYSKLKVISKSMMGNMNMDSESTDDNVQNKITKSMMGKIFYFTLTKRGVVEKIEGTENIYSGLSTLGLDEATLATTKQTIQQTISDKSLKASLEMGLVNYPDKKVKAGDTWTNTTATALNFPMQINNNWSLKTLEKDLATIDADGNLTTTDKEKITSLPNGIKSKIDLSGHQKLSGKVNAKSGWPSEIKVSSEITGNMMLLAGGMIPEDMDVPMEILTETKFTIVKK